MGDRFPMPPPLSMEESYQRLLQPIQANIARLQGEIIKAMDTANELARLAGMKLPYPPATPGAQESRPLTWTREKPTAPGLYRVRKHKFVSSAEVWTHPSFGRSFDMNCEDLSPHDPEIEWCGPYPEPQTLSEGGATA